MNSEITIREKIENDLNNFDSQPLRAAATQLLNALGYHSNRVGNDAIDEDRLERLTASALDTANPTQKLRIDDWLSFFQIMQITDDEIDNSLFGGTEIDDTLIDSYMFVTLKLTGSAYTRTQLADITRFINMNITQDRQARRPIMVIFRYGDVLTLSIINRRENKRDTSKRVLEKVTLIKDINLTSPKRAHIDIISELYLHRLIENEGVNNFDTLHKAWEGILNTEALNKDFYRDLEEWYEWAKRECTFPDSANDMQVIRMVTRLLFIWFLKEKGLVPTDLFEDYQATPPPPLYKR